MMNGNGHTNGLESGGVGGRDRPRHPARAGLARLRSLVVNGGLDGEDMELAATFARNVLRDENSSNRDKQAAAWLLDALVGRTIAAADKTEHYERLDAGEDTARVGGLTFVIQEATTRL